MNRFHLYLLFKVVLAIPPIAVYLILCYFAMLSGEMDTAVGIFRHVILIPGLVPLCAWLTLIFLAKSSTILKLILFAIAVTLFHWFVFAMSAHRDGLAYWGVQVIELAALVLLVRIARIKQPDNAQVG